MPTFHRQKQHLSKKRRALGWTQKNPIVSDFFVCMKFFVSRAGILFTRRSHRLVSLADSLLLQSLGFQKRKTLCLFEIPFDPALTHTKREKPPKIGSSSFVSRAGIEPARDFSQRIFLPSTVFTAPESQDLWSGLSLHHIL